MTENQKILVRLKQFVRKKALLNPTSFFLIFQLLRFVSILKKGDKLRRLNEKRYCISIPSICILSVNNACNLKCKGCYATANSFNETLNINEIDKVVDEAISLGIYLFVIAGGEPLLVNNLIETLIKHSNAVFLVFTNGLLIDSKVVKLFKKNLNVIPVLSYEGNIALNNSRCGENHGSRIEDSLKKLRKSKIIYGFSTMAFHENIEYITSKPYFDKMQKYRASFGFIIDYMPGEYKIEYSMLLSVKDIALKNRELNKRRKDSNLEIFNLPGDEKISCDCWASEKLLVHINASGNVEPCTFFNHSVDNIRQKPLVEILQSDFFQDLKSHTKCNNNSKRLCDIKLLAV